jgi:glycosyltransferase involved in cell wall biosynthesis
VTVGAGQEIMDLTVVVLTYNEEPNIFRSLNSVRWVERIVVIDSGSSDRTVHIAESFPNVTVVYRAFTTHAEQWNFGLEHVKTTWTLAMDADYVFPDSAPAAIRSAMLNDGAGYSAGFDYLVYGIRVYGSILPPRTVLFRTANGRYWQDGHTQQLQLNGSLGLLPFHVSHDDRKPLSRWLQSQINYARQEADKISSSPGAELGRNDRIRKAVVLAPPLVFLLVYVIRGGILSGWRGLFYALQRLTFEVLLSLFLIDVKLQSLLQTSDSREPE